MSDWKPRRRCVFCDERFIPSPRHKTKTWCEKHTKKEAYEWVFTPKKKGEK